MSEFSLPNVSLIFNILVSKFLGVILRSTLSYSVYQQLDILGEYYLSYFALDFKGVLAVPHPDTSFYNCINKINEPYITPFTGAQILHGPVLIML